MLWAEKVERCFGSFARPLLRSLLLPAAGGMTDVRWPAWLILILGDMSKPAFLCLHVHSHSHTHYQRNLPLLPPAPSPHANNHTTLRHPYRESRIQRPVILRT